MNGKERDDIGRVKAENVMEHVKHTASPFGAKQAAVTTTCCLKLSYASKLSGPYIRLRQAPPPTPHL
jgi:hypothetical protein